MYVLGPTGRVRTYVLKKIHRYSSFGVRLCCSTLVPYVEAEVEAQCATLCRRIGDEVAKSACYMMAGLIGDLMKVRQRRMMMQYQLQAADPHGGGGK